MSRVEIKKPKNIAARNLSDPRYRKRIVPKKSRKKEKINDDLRSE